MKFETDRNQKMSKADELLAKKRQQHLLFEQKRLHPGKERERISCTEDVNRLIEEVPLKQYLQKDEKVNFYKE